MRKTIEESWRTLEALGNDMPRLPDGSPHLPTRMPNFGDEVPVNIAFFRMHWENTDLSELTLPRMFFARSGFECVNFRGIDLSESRMCWNDFIKCDFSESNLRRCDMRATVFDCCLFRNADLRGVDLRRSRFDACIFEGAILAGAIAHKQSSAADLIPLLSMSQRDEIRWVLELGDEPPGG
jgi:uncharacterized protein YjbI with pentapeptide repeats